MPLMLQALANLRMLHACVLACVLALVLAACGSTTPQPTAGVVGIERLAMCDGANVWQYEVSAEQIVGRTLLLKLPNGARCPIWSPLSRHALLALPPSNVPTDARTAQRMQWFDGRTRTLEDFTALAATDVRYQPLWQREGRPVMAVLSTREAGDACGELTAMYAAASSSVPSVRDAASRAALTTAQNALRGGAMTVALTAQVMCPVAKPDPFLIDPDGVALQLPALPNSVCDLSPAPNGLWLLATTASTTGNCRRNNFGRSLNLTRIDTGRMITIPLDAAVHGIQRVFWQPYAAAFTHTPHLLIAAQRLAGARKELVFDLFLYSPAEGLADGEGTLQLLVSGLPSFDDARWLMDGSVLLFFNRAVYHMQLTDLAPTFLHALPALAEKCVSQFSVSADERYILQQDSCDGLVGQLRWIELQSGTSQRLELFQTVSGHSLISPDSQWLVTEALERYQFTIRSHTFLVRMRDGLKLDIGVQSSAVQMDWLHD